MYILNFNSLGHRELCQYGVGFCKKEVKMLFLDASSHLYKRVCPLVHRSVHPSVTRFFRVTLSNSGQLWATMNNSEDTSIGQLTLGLIYLSIFYSINIVTMIFYSFAL